jgi:hypothetical protein
MLWSVISYVIYSWQFCLEYTISSTDLSQRIDDTIDDDSTNSEEITAAGTCGILILV